MSEPIRWDQVIPVFLSALLAMLVGVALEYFRGAREKRRSKRERELRELQQINGVTVGIAYNVEVVLHAVFQSFLPHHQQSHEAYRALQAAAQDSEKLTVFARDLHRYPALMMTAPPMHFEEFDFLDKLPFLIEKDAELVKKSGWMRRQSRVLDTAIADRNRSIADASRQVMSTGGALNFYQLDRIIQMQATIATGECVTACELIENLLSIATSLEAITRTYPGGGKRVEFPATVNDALQRLRAIRGNAIAEMPSVK